MRSWYLAPSFARPEAYASFEELFQPAQQHPKSDRRTWQAEVDFGDDDFIHHHVFSTSNQTFLDSMLGDVEITESSQVDGSSVDYTFTAVRFRFVQPKHS